MVESWMWWILAYALLGMAIAEILMWGAPRFYKNIGFTRMHYVITMVVWPILLAVSIRSYLTGEQDDD